MDWNNDGYIDLIVGDRNGFITFFQRGSDGSLQTGVKLLSDGTTLDAGGNSAPDFEDFDLDGDLDMIVGTDGTAPVRYYENTGTAESYQFDGYVNFQAGGQDVTLYRSSPAFYDMNQDGLFDVVMGCLDKKFHYYENTGTAGSPVFAADDPLEYQTGGDVQMTYSQSRPDVCDWNEDGHFDLIAGNVDFYVFLYYAYDGVGVEGSTSGLVAPSVFTMKENPVRNTLSVNVNMGQTTSPEFTVYTMDGRAVLTHTAGTLNPGQNTVVIQNQLPNGAYFIKCSAGNRTFTERFVVVR